MQSMTNIDDQMLMRQDRNTALCHWAKGGRLGVGWGGGGVVGGWDHSVQQEAIDHPALTVPEFEGLKLGSVNPPQSPTPPRSPTHLYV